MHISKRNIALIALVLKGWKVGTIKIY